MVDKAWAERVRHAEQAAGVYDEPVDTNALLYEFHVESKELIDRCTMGSPENRLKALEELADAVERLRDLVEAEVGS